MEEKILNILIVEDDQLDVELIQYELKKFGFAFKSLVVDNKSEYLEALRNYNPDIILSDYSMPKFDGMTSLLTRNEKCPLIPFIVVTGSINEETAVVCIKAGANDYIIKDNLKRLGPAVKAAIEQSEIQKEKLRLIEVLRESETFNRLLVENQVDLICRWNLDFKLTFVNNAYARFYELPKEEIVGKNLLDFVPLHSKDLIKQHYFELFEHPIIDTYEYDVVVLKDNIHWIEWTDCPLFDEKGILFGFQSTGRDITHKKFLDEQIQNQLSFIHSLLESSPIPVFYKDTKFKYTGCNSAYERFLGISSDLIIGKTVYDLNEKEQADIFHKEDLVTMKKGFNRTFETKIKDKRDIWHDVIVQKSPLRDNKSNIIGIIGAFVDISERKKIEEELKKSEEKYRLITDNINDLVWVMDLNLNSIFVSPSFHRILGYTVEERLSISTEKLLTPESYKKVVNTIKDTVNKIQNGIIKDKNHTVKIEVEQIRKDGTIFWAESNVSATYDKNGRIIGIQGVTRDISVRKEAEEELKRSEEKYKNIFENIQDVYYETTLEGLVLEISPSIIKISNYTREEILGKNMMDFYSNPEIRISLLKEFSENGYVDDYEVTLCDKDGIKKRCAITAKVIFNESKQPLKIVGSMRNIEERKKTEDELQQLLNTLETRVNQRTEELSRTQELYYTTVNSLIDWVFVIDNNYNIVFVNQILKDFFLGYGVKADVIGRNLKDVFVFLTESDFAFYDKVFANFQIEISEGSYTVFGKKYYTQTKLSPVISNKKVIRIVTTIHDNTKQKLIEEEIKINLQKEKELNMLKTRFISVVSHEFRTPLASIQSSIQLIDGYRNKLKEEKIKSLFSGIYETIRYSNILLDDISIIGKDESGKLEINLAETDIREICKQCIDDTKAIFGDSSEFNFIISPDIKYAWVDESILRHVLNNILSNAIKYSDTSKPVIFKVDLKDKYIIFNIEDNGRGIPEEDLKNIFEPFHRASNVENIKGTGLGLAIVKRCVELHGGTIQLKSKLGKGTKVFIKIPYGRVKSEK